MTVDLVQLVNDRPEVLWSIVADIVKVAKAEQSGHTVGRRPDASVDSIDELYEVLFPPAYATLPFAQEVRRLLGVRSQRWLAHSAGISFGHLTDQMSGRRPLSNATIEAVARVFKVAPHWFPEYRTTVFVDAVKHLLERDPQRSVAWIQRMAATPATRRP